MSQGSYTADAAGHRVTAWVEDGVWHARASHRTDGGSSAGSPGLLEAVFAEVGLPGVSDHLTIQIAVSHDGRTRPRVRALQEQVAGFAAHPIAALEAARELTALLRERAILAADVAEARGNSTLAAELRSAA